MVINDAHCHFFSSTFFDVLGRQTGRQPTPTSDDLCAELGWQAPGAAAALADRWVAELDAHGVARAVLIASVPGDEESVAHAVARFPSRLVGFFMVNPAAPDAVARTERGTQALGLRGVCLFPAMHGVGLDDDRVGQVVAAAAQVPGVCVFVHCGVLSVGVRGKLGLPSPFDSALGRPLDVARLAERHPHTTFVIPHFGAGRLDEALDAARRCPNIVFDTSSSNGWIQDAPGLTLTRVFERTLDVMGATRLLFGTDSSFFPRGWQRGVYDAQRSALQDSGADEHQQALIFGGNFDRVLPAET